MFPEGLYIGLKGASHIFKSSCQRVAISPSPFVNFQAEVRKKAGFHFRGEVNISHCP